jgi:hypothetical protein
MKTLRHKKKKHRNKKINIKDLTLVNHLPIVQGKQILIVQIIKVNLMKDSEKKTKKKINTHHTR